MRTSLGFAAAQRVAEGVTMNAARIVAIAMIVAAAAVILNLIQPPLLCSRWVVAAAHPPNVQP